MRANRRRKERAVASGEMVQLRDLQLASRYCRDPPPSAWLRAAARSARRRQRQSSGRHRGQSGQLRPRACPARRVSGALLVRHRRYGRKEGDLAARPVGWVHVAGRWATFVSLNPATGGPPLGTDGLAGGCRRSAGPSRCAERERRLRATVSSSSTWTASTTATATGPVRCESAGTGYAQSSIERSRVVSSASVVVASTWRSMAVASDQVSCSGQTDLHSDRVPRQGRNAQREGGPRLPRRPRAR